MPLDVRAIPNSSLSHRKLTYGIQTLVDGATVSWNLSLGLVATVTIAGNRTLANPTNGIAGQTIAIQVVQDGTGGRTLTFDTGYVFPNGTPTLDTGAGAKTLYSFVYDGTSFVCNQVAGGGGGGLSAINATSILANATGSSAVPTGLTINANETVVESGGVLVSSKIIPHRNIDYSVLTLTDAVTIAWDVSQGLVASVTLGGNRTLGAPTNAVSGQRLSLKIAQDATGGRTLAFNAAFTFPAGAINIATAANAVTFLSFLYDGTNFICEKDPTGAAGTLTDGDKGDITVSGTGTVFTIDALSVTSAKLAANSATAAKIANNAVTTAKILDSNVTTAKIADDAVTNVKLANMAAVTIKGNATAAAADPQDIAVGLNQLLVNTGGVLVSQKILPHLNVTPSVFALTDGATINWNTASGVVAEVTLAGNRTLAAPTSLVAGQNLILSVIQDGTGNRTLAWNSVFKFPGGIVPVLTSTAGARDIFFMTVVTTTFIAVTYLQDVR